MALRASVAVALLAGASAFGVGGAGPAAMRAAPARGAAARSAAPPAMQQAKGGKNNEELIPDEPTLQDWVNNAPFAMSKSLARQTLLSQTMEPEPLPAVWDIFWDTMPFLKAGAKGDPLTFGDVARTFKVNIEQIFGGIPAPDGAPLAAADVEGLDFKALCTRRGSRTALTPGPSHHPSPRDRPIVTHCPQSSA